MRLDAVSVEELVSRFVEIGSSQDDALLYNEIDKFNRLFDEETDILTELKSRDGDQRRVLLGLYTHPNMQVRLNAAKATLAIAPERAQEALESIRGSRRYPQAGDAGMSLRNLRSGVFMPT